MYMPFFSFFRFLYLYLWAGDFTKESVISSGLAFGSYRAGVVLWHAECSVCIWFSIFKLMIAGYCGRDIKGLQKCRIKTCQRFDSIRIFSALRNRT